MMITPTTSNTPTFQIGMIGMSLQPLSKGNIMKNYNKSTINLVFLVAKVALENSVSSDIVSRELDFSPEELDKLYEMINKNFEERTQL
jgi:hypothetical protein